MKELQLQRTKSGNLESQHVQLHLLIPITKSVWKQELHHSGSFDCPLCGKETQFLSKEAQQNHMK